MPANVNGTLDDMPDEDGISIVRQEVSALEAITRSEVAMQLDSAHRWPRNVTKFRDDAISMVTLNKKIAESCMYSVPRDGKMITGPSVRLAEMIVSAWGNMHTGARVIEVGERELTAQAVAWDLEKNLRITIEAQRSIMGDRGRKRYSDSMIQTTGMAAISVALRNAIFRVIPRAYVDDIYEIARECAVGDIKTLASRRDEWMAWLGKKGITPDRVFARLEVAGVGDITLAHLEVLIGIGTSLKSNELTIDEAFPPVHVATPAPPRSKNAHLDALTNVHKPKAPPAKTLTPAEVHAALAKAAPEWEGEDRLQWMTNEWTPGQMLLAWDWAIAFADDKIDDENVPPRPAFTILAAPEVAADAPAERQPGEGE
jgi:hypothetical protein